MRRRRLRGIGSRQLRIVKMHVDEGENIAQWYRAHAHHDYPFPRFLCGPLRENPRRAKCLICLEALEVIDKNQYAQAN
jgi:hypothetical protein